MNVADSTQRRWLAGGFGLAALLLLGLALLDLMLVVSPAQVLDGEPFIYPAYVGGGGGVYWSIAGFGLLVTWFFLRRHTWLAALRPASALLISLACGLLTLFAPLQALQAPAYPLTYLTHEEFTWQAFYQNLPLPDPTCPFVVVRCDSLGLRCEAVARLDLAAVCLGPGAGLALRVDEAANALQVLVQGEALLAIPLPDSSAEE